MPLSKSRIMRLPMRQELHNTVVEEFDDTAFDSLDESDDDEDLDRIQEYVSNNYASKNVNRPPLPAYFEKYLSDLEQETTQITILEANSTEATDESKLPVIAIIGRPNTGKSTLVNRISGLYKDGSIVMDEPGITRDRTYRVCNFEDHYFQMVDTGGIVFDESEVGWGHQEKAGHRLPAKPSATKGQSMEALFQDRIMEQALAALREADAAIFVVDGMEGVNDLDENIAKWLRMNGYGDDRKKDGLTGEKAKKMAKIYLAVNKCESFVSGRMQANEFWSLGMGTPHPVSAIHGTGVADLLTTIISEGAVTKVLAVKKEEAINVAIVGRPNVGKSSLFNRFVGSNRSIVSDIAGTTRDSIDAVVQRGNSSYRIVDTAGIRRRSRIDKGLETFMVNRALKAIRRSDISIMLLDATDGIVDQDMTLASRINEEGRACVIALNKWDAVPDKDEKSYLKAEDNIRTKLTDLSWAEIVCTSAQTGQRSDKVLAAVTKAYDSFKKKIPTSTINEVIRDALIYQSPPALRNRVGRVYFTLQVATGPPTFVLFVNDPALFPPGYRRYMERKLRETCVIGGTPIKMRFKGKSIRQMSRADKKGIPSGSSIRGTGGDGGGGGGGGDGGIGGMTILNRDRKRERK